MGKRLPHTPRSKIKSALRLLWLRSRERAAALKRDKNTCQDCGVKGSQAKGNVVKTEVHHINGIEWDDIINYIMEHLLIDPEGLITLCIECHLKTHGKDKENGKTKRYNKKMVETKRCNKEKIEA